MRQFIAGRVWPGSGLLLWLEQDCFTQAERTATFRQCLRRPSRADKWLTPHRAPLPFFLSSLFLSKFLLPQYVTKINAFRHWRTFWTCRKVIATLYHTALRLSVRHDIRLSTLLGAIKNEQGRMRSRRQNAQCCKIQGLKMQQKVTVVSCLLRVKWRQAVVC